MRMLPSIAILLVLAAATGCRGRDPADIASNGALPPVHDPIGPVPGLGGPARRSATNPYSNDPVALQQGRELFVVMNCSGCHGGHAGGGMGPSLRDVDWIYGNSDADIYSSIAQGRAHGMPAWGTRLPDQSIWMLVAYVKSLRTANEPDPPR